MAAGVLCLAIGGMALASAQEPPLPGVAQRPVKAPTPHVGSAMAVLATLEQAQVLPPENTPEANHVIQSVIQFQSAFTKADDASIRDFVVQAVAKKYDGAQAADLIARFRSTGWTASMLEALADAEEHSTAEELQRLTPGFQRFNLSTQDFHQFMRLVRAARDSFDKQGVRFEQVFASYRQTMPGARAQ